MELSNIASILYMIGAVNIFYAMYGLTEVNWVNTLIPTVTYLILIYAGAQVDGKAEELRRKEWT